MSFRAVVEATGLSLEACAGSLGVDQDLFRDWADSKREMPPAYATELAAVLGVKLQALTSRAGSASSRAQIAPSAIWFKLRGKDFTDADRESILLVRKLGHNANQLERATDGTTNNSWAPIFETVLKAVDAQASPQDQGKSAARAFASLTQIAKGGKGCASYLRGSLRAKGILLIETSVPHSQIEGCSFLVGDTDSPRPCLFINTYGSTWFRRNVVIMHELGHAIFDQNAVVIDRIEASGDQQNSLSEARAEAFARECMLPRNLLLTFFSRTGTSPTKLLPESLAALVDFSGVEKKTVIAILRENELIDDDLESQYQNYNIIDELRGLSDHALSTKEFVAKIGFHAAKEWLDKRFTTLGSRRLLLPVNFVKAVVDAVRSYSISIGRAAELLMIDRETFEGRFPGLVAEVSE